MKEKKVCKRLHNKILTKQHENWKLAKFLHKGKQFLLNKLNNELKPASPSQKGVIPSVLKCNY